MDNQKNFYENLGQKLRACRKAKNMTLAELADALNKSLATVSKYEKGEIAIDVEVLVDFCRILNVDITYLLPSTKSDIQDGQVDRYREHLIERLYVYYYKITDGTLHLCVVENNNSTRKSTMYYDVRDAEDIHDCRFIYFGDVIYTDTNVFFIGQNTVPPYDVTTLSIPNMSSLRASVGNGYRIGLMTTLTMYYQMVGIKCVTSRTPIHDRDFLIEKLVLTPEEVKWVKTNNVFNIFI